MIVAITLAAAFAAGLDWRRVALLAAAIYQPILAASILALVAWWSRPEPSEDAVVFCEGVASELRSGSSLRSAVSSVASSMGMDVDESSPIDEVAGELAGGLGDVGEAIAVTIRTAHRAGSDSAALFDEIGAMALGRAETARELRMASAPAKATGAVLVGAPLLYVLARLMEGDIADQWMSVPQRVAGVAGLAIFCFGLLVASLVFWRALR